MSRSGDYWHTKIVLLFNYRSELGLLVGHSATVVINFSQQSVKIALKKEGNGIHQNVKWKSIFLKRKIIGPRTGYS